MSNRYLATAFLSCSLNEKDSTFINFVERILKSYRIKIVGTVGKYFADADNPVKSMTKKISEADFIVVVATSRYLSKDIFNGNKQQTISEQLHAEAGIANGLNKPIVLFVQEGTNPGNFMPSITQYITLNGSIIDLNNKRRLIASLLKNVLKRVNKIKENETIRTLSKITICAFAVYGFYELIKNIKKDSPR